MFSRVTEEILKFVPHVEIIDPLGEIRRSVLQFWVKDGKPESANWQEYWQRAETLVLGKREPAHGATQVNDKRTISDSPSAVLPEGSTPEGVLLATALGKVLDLHESYCLARLMRDSKFRLAGGEELGPLGVEKIAELLADLSDELAPFAQDNPDKASKFERDVRQQMWSGYLKEFFASDDPLHYAERNTIARLKSKLLENAQIAEIKIC